MDLDLEPDVDVSERPTKLLRHFASMPEICLSDAGEKEDFLTEKDSAPPHPPPLLPFLFILVSSFASVVLYVFDVVSDLLLATVYFLKRHDWWARLTLFFTLAPGFVVAGVSIAIILRLPGLPPPWRATGLATAPFLMGPAFLRLERCRAATKTWRERRKAATAKRNVASLRRGNPQTDSGFGSTPEFGANSAGVTDRNGAGKSHGSVIGKRSSLSSLPSDGVALRHHDVFERQRPEPNEPKEILPLTHQSDNSPSITVPLSVRLRAAPFALRRRVDETFRDLSVDADAGSHGVVVLEVLLEALPQILLQLYIMLRSNLISGQQIVTLGTSMLTAVFSLQQFSAPLHRRWLLLLSPSLSPSSSSFPFRLFLSFLVLLLSFLRLVSCVFLVLVSAVSLGVIVVPTTDVDRFVVVVVLVAAFVLFLVLVLLGSKMADVRIRAPFLKIFLCYSMAMVLALTSGFCSANFALKKRSEEKSNNKPLFEISHDPVGIASPNFSVINSTPPNDILSTIILSKLSQSDLFFRSLDVCDFTLLSIGHISDNFNDKMKEFWRENVLCATHIFVQLQHIIFVSGSWLLVEAVGLLVIGMLRL